MFEKAAKQILTPSLVFQYYDKIFRIENITN